MFWDSSALVPLLLPEATSAAMAAAMKVDSEPAMWWASAVECQSAIYRRHRETPIPRDLLAKALERLDSLNQDLAVISASEEMRKRAGRLLALHPLRAAGALQLAAAMIWSEDEPMEESFVCQDDRLREAAHREGFTLLPA